MTTLLDRGLVTEVGRRETVGRPALLAIDARVLAVPRACSSLDELAAVAEVEPSRLRQTHERRSIHLYTVAAAWLLAPAASSCYVRGERDAGSQRDGALRCTPLSKRAGSNTASSQAIRSPSSGSPVSQARARSGPRAARRRRRRQLHTCRRARSRRRGVRAEVVEHGRGEKIIVFRYKSQGPLPPQDGPSPVADAPADHRHPARRRLGFDVGRGQSRRRHRVEAELRRDRGRRISPLVASETTAAGRRASNPSPEPASD